MRPIVRKNFPTCISFFSRISVFNSLSIGRNTPQGRTLQLLWYLLYTSFALVQLTVTTFLVKAKANLIEAIRNLFIIFPCFGLSSARLWIIALDFIPNKRTISEGITENVTVWYITISISFLCLIKYGNDFRYKTGILVIVFPQVLYCLIFTPL